MAFNQTKALIPILISLLGAVMGWAIVAGRPEIIIVAFTAALLVKYLSRKQMKTREITSDELVVKIAEKAARLSFSIFGIIASLAGAVLMAADHVEKGPLYYAGFTLSMAVTALFLLNLSFSFYYRRKFYDQK